MDYSKLKIPNHVAIIVDGNGRWARERGLSRSKGHDAGAERFKTIINYIFKRNVKIISAYVFSTENFKRSQEEIDHMMKLFVNGFKKDKFYLKKNIKIIFSGRKELLDDEVLDAMSTITEETKNNDGGILNICLNYGGRSEIIDATKKIIKEVIENKINIDDIDEKLFSNYLYQDLPDVDLMIRTSGELRLSNFLLWQNSYAEFYFPKVYFPDFTEEEFDKAILEYTRRDRRYGNIDYSK